MKILIPIWGFGQSGGDRVLSQLANHWINSGHSVSFITSQYSKKPYFPTKADIIWINIFGQRVDEHTLIRPKRPGLPMFLSLFAGLIRHSVNYDVILANHSLTAWPVAISVWSKKRFYYVQAYEPEYYRQDWCFKNLFPYILSKLSYRLPLTKIANAPIYVNDKLVNAKDYVPPGIDFDVFYPKSDHLSDFNGVSEIVIGCIGRKEPHKGIKYLLEAYEQFEGAAELKVAYGNLPLLEVQTKQYSVAVPSNDFELSDFYRSLDLLVAPGTVQHGAYHYPVMEAIACGTPVLHTGYLPGNQENSWLCSPSSSESIRKEIENFAASDKKIIRKKVQQGLKDIANLSWPHVSEQFIRLFNEK